MLRGRYEELIWEPDFDRPGGSKRRSSTYEAFVPDEIASEEFELSSSSATLTEKAASAVVSLNKGSEELIPLEGLARQLLRSEALASSQMEGLSISHRKLAEAELEGFQGHHKATEIVANVQAMERAVEIGASSDSFSVDDIASIHAEVAIVPPLDKIAGEIRQETSWIGGTAPPDADYVGPPHEFVVPLLEDLCAFMDRDDLPVVLQAAVAHAQFETIHPFGDGNGRVGRCLIHVIFRRRDIAPRYVPPVSLVLGANKDSYIAGLESFREGRAEIWIDQFSRAVSVAAERASSFSSDVRHLQEEWLGRVGKVRSDSAVIPIIDLLSRYPIITAAVAESEIMRSRVATIKALKRLSDAGIVSRHRNQKKGDSWEARELFSLLKEFEASVKLPTH